MFHVKHCKSFIYGKASVALDLRDGEVLREVGPLF